MFISTTGFLVRRCGEGWGRRLQGHVNKTSVKIGIRFQMPGREVLVLRGNSVDLESGGEEFFVSRIVVFEFVE